MTSFTPAQQQAIEHVYGPALVVAGAGTGKTRVITERIAKLIADKHAQPEEIVALTFTEKAAGEMQDRLDELLPYGVFGTRVSTFHSFCRDILSRHAYRAGIDPNAQLIGKAEAVSLLKTHFRRFTLTNHKPTNNPTSFLRDLFDFYERTSEEAIDAAALRNLAKQQESDEAGQERAAELEELAHCVETVQAIYHENRILTYSGLIAGVRQLFKISAAALDDERERTKFILIDEFQDTNTAQAEIAYALAGTEANIMVVGDDDQSIYRFRGANLDNILTFRDTFQKAKLITLTDNFRSSQAILDTAYRLVSNNNPHRLEVIEGFNKKLKAHREIHIPVEHLRFEHEYHEVEGVVSRIAGLVEEGMNPGDIAILSRSHAALDTYEAELQSRGVPTARSKQGSLYDQPGPRQALAFLRFLVQPNESYNLFNLLIEEPFSVPLRALQPLNAEVRRLKKSLWECVTESVDESLEGAKEFLQNALIAEHRFASKAMLSFVKESRFEAQLTESDNYQALQNLNTLYREVVTFEKLQRQASIAQVIAHIDDLIDSGGDTLVAEEPPESADSVQLLTIHASKGLEFPVVFMVNMVRDRFPMPNRSNGIKLPQELTSPSDEQVKYEEERRLAYVACTRARDRLILTRADKYAGNKKGKAPSIFVKEALGSDEVEVTPVTLSTAFTSKAALSSDLPEITFPEVLSASALEAFEDSPARYRDEHIYRLIQEENPLTSFGSAVHKTLYAATAALQSGEPFDVDAYYEEQFDPSNYFDAIARTERYEKGLKAIHAYLQAHETPQNTLFEQSISWKYSANLTIIGKVDRIEQSADGTVRIVDYKTGESEKKLSDVKKNLPLGLYALALRAQGRNVASVELHYLLREECIALEVTEKYLNEIEARLEKILEEMKVAYETGVFQK